MKTVEEVQALLNGCCTLSPDAWRDAVLVLLNAGIGGEGSIGDVTVETPTVSAAHTETIIAVGISNTSVLAAYASRIGGWVKNISEDYIWVSFSATATTAKPTKLAPGATLPLVGDGWGYTGAVSAIQTAGGTLNLEVVEL